MRESLIKADAIIVSAGKGQRLRGGKKKQFFSLAGKPILSHTLAPFEMCPLIRSILLVVGEEDLEYCLKEVVEPFRYQKVSKIIPGGKRRQDSVKNGIDALPKDTEIVVIHDGVRPFVTPEIIEASIERALRSGAVIVAVPVKDTIKRATSDGTILETLDRSSLWHAQTPQTFKASILREVYNKGISEEFIAPDDASIVERLGIKVHLLLGSYSNIKITTQEDLAFAHFLLQMKTKGENL
ncbi:MAG: 2-C-methyl-D-erythritol 4-phosphate cytidylyltransferase [Thermodesulfobacteriota bacterium]